MDAKNLADLYDCPLLDWNRVASRLDAGWTAAPGTGGPNRHTCWLATIDPDGRPHVTGMGALWHDGAFWFETGPGTRKARNVARDPRATLSISLDEYDVIVEGTVERVTDRGRVAELAAIWNEGWPCRVDDSGIALTAEFSAPSAGPPPWWVYRLTLTSATALHTAEPGGATRWRF
ncbi:MAG TPA: pyridoxamine 5'-phosphate oxidase family protein [Acidimicrobiia bacterium]|nr:pyridoxamine 5'-phosphate oxidase family protein [Acidimicrobiia bacterium]